MSSIRTGPTADEKEEYNQAMHKHRTKRRYHGGGYNIYKPKGLIRQVPRWPEHMLAKRPDKGKSSRIVKAFVHSPKRKVALHNPYNSTANNDGAPPDHIASTLARIKKSTVLSPRRRYYNKLDRNPTGSTVDSDLPNLTANTATWGQQTRAKLERGKSLHKTMQGSQAIKNAYESNNSQHNIDNDGKFTIDPRTMYLLSNYLAFDKFDQHERTEIINELLGKWLGEEYRNINNGTSMLWDSIRSYCESTYMLDRITSRRKTPNALSAAACCELLGIISRKEQRYGRILRIIKDGIYDSIYVEKEGSNVPFFHRKTWFTEAKVTKEALRRTRRHMKEMQIHDNNNNNNNNNNVINSMDRQNNKQSYLKHIVQHALPSELAREINSMGQDYVLVLMNELKSLQTQKIDEELNDFVYGQKSDAMETNIKNQVEYYSDYSEAGSEEPNIAIRNWN